MAIAVSVGIPVAIHMDIITCMSVYVSVRMSIRNTIRQTRRPPNTLRIPFANGETSDTEEVRYIEYDERAESRVGKKGEDE